MAGFFITGGTGFVGDHLIGSIPPENNTVYCLTRRKRKHFTGVDSDMWIEADLLDIDSYKDILKKVDYVFHLAGLIHARKRGDYIRTNVKGTEMLLKACREVNAPVKRFVYMSSIAAMGANYDGKLLRESDACSPRTEYGKSKLQAEQVVREFSRVLPVVILRPTYIYGRGDLRGLKFLKTICNQPVSSLTPFIKTISLCHISDIIGSCFCAIEKEIKSGHIFIISDPGVYSRDQVRDIVREVISELLSKEPGKEKKELSSFFESTSTADIFEKRITRHQYWGCDVTKAKIVLGFQPKIPLKEGVIDTLKWYLTEGLLIHDLI
jgi:nucleoside-diphosphate-sugar epimerase